MAKKTNIESLNFSYGKNRYISNATLIGNKSRSELVWIYNSDQSASKSRIEECKFGR